MCIQSKKKNDSCEDNTWDSLVNVDTFPHGCVKMLSPVKYMSLYPVYPSYFLQSRSKTDWGYLSVITCYILGKEKCWSISKIEAISLRKIHQRFPCKCRHLPPWLGQDFISCPEIQRYMRKCIHIHLGYILMIASSSTTVLPSSFTTYHPFFHHLFYPSFAQV